MTTQLLVSTDWLVKHLSDPKIRIVDVRWYLFDKDKTGQSEYARGHIPGAVHADIDADLSRHDVDGPGRHPIPSAQAFAASMSRLGIDANTHVIGYDDRGGATAARLWFLLRYFGHEQVSLLDGGIAQWIAEGRALETQTPNAAYKRFVTQSPHREMIADKMMVGALARDSRALVVDVRVGERYRGEVEPIDSRAGHIPGAENAPIGGNLQSATDMRFLEPEKIRARFESLGAKRSDEVIAYCGSGINACQTVFALTLAGFENVILYEGSWSDWSRDKNLPAATGANP